MRTTRRPAGWMLLLIAVPLGAGCGGSTDAGPVPTTLIVLVDQVQSTSISFTAVGQTRQVTTRVLDQNGDTLTGFTPTYTSADETVVTVNPTGVVTSVKNGTTALEVAAASLSRNLSVAVSQISAQVLKLQGDQQAGSAGEQLPLDLRVRVSDPLGRGVPGAGVVFNVSAGGGSVSVGTVTADELGEASTAWTLGTTVGTTQQVTVTSGGAPAAVFGATMSAGPAAEITKVAGDGQTGAENLPLPINPRVRVSDEFGNVKAGATVLFAVATGDGGITGATQATNAAGEAEVGSWTLGPGSGEQTLTASVVGTGLSVTFTATAQVAGEPASVVAFVGNGQTSLRGYPTNLRPAVRLTDAGGLPVGGVSVTFTPSAGGSVTGGTVSTDPNGVAQVGSWTPGQTAGAYTLSASVAAEGVSGNPVQFAGTAEDPLYNIEVRYLGSTPSPGVVAAISEAAARWQQVIYRNLAAVTLNVPAGQCFATQPAINEQIDDVLILVEVVPMDGQGGVVASAGPCYVRGSNALTVMGLMRLDETDVGNFESDGRLFGVVLHEMGHVLGFGTLWDVELTNGFTIRCLEDPSSVGSVRDTHFACLKGRAAFDSVGGTGYTAGAKVPVENCAQGGGCGAGSFNGHWRESVFDREVMTPFVESPGVATPLSVVSIAAMEDIGYTVNYASADAYVQSVAAPGVALATVAEGAWCEVWRSDIRVVDRQGRVVGVIRR